MKRLLIACLVLALAACAAPSRECPRDGGIGGTGGCPPPQTLE